MHTGRGRQVRSAAVYPNRAGEASRWLRGACQEEATDAIVYVCAHLYDSTQLAHCQIALLQAMPRQAHPRSPTCYNALVPSRAHTQPRMW